MLARITSVAEERDFEAYVQALFKSGDNTRVRSALAELEVPAPYRLRVKVLYAPSSPVSVMEKLLDRETLQTLSNESRAYVFNTTVGRKNLRTFQVPFVIASFEDDKLLCHVQAIIAICKSDHWKALGRFIRNNYPDIVPILLSQSELIRGAQRLKQSGHDVRVRAFSAKESVRGVPGKYRKSERVWTDEELDEALRSIQERRQIITSLDVDFFPRIGDYTHVRPKTACKIRKDGEIEVTGGFLLAFNAVAKQVAQVGEKKLQFFSGRGLRESKYKPRPLAIKFALPILEDLEVLQNFVQVLVKYPHSMHAVEHGNPYAHVKVTDLYDWSSFDVWAISPQRVALIPGLKATEAAFERLIHYIFEAFREGRVTTYDHEERALEEGA